MSQSDSEYLSEIIFQRSRKQQLQFELGFAPLLATVVGLISPGGIRGTIVVLAVVVLVLFSFLRWLTFTGRFASEELFTEKTVRPVEICAIIGVVQVFHYVAVKLNPFFSLSVAEVITGLTALGTLLFVLFVEIVFQTYQLGWGSLFYLRYRNAAKKTGELDSAEKVIQAIDSIGELFGLLVLVILGRVWLEIAYYLLRGATPEEGRDKYIEELAEFVEKAHTVKSSGRNYGIVGTFVFSAIVVLPVFVGVAWGLSLVLGTFGALLLALVTVRLTKHIIGFSYIAFGTLRFDQFITTNIRSVGLLSGYTVVVYWLFFIRI
jgi:hypothetical protein